MGDWFDSAKPKFSATFPADSEWSGATVEVFRGDYEIPEGSMRVGPGTDAVVWRTCPTHKATP